MKLQSISIEASDKLSERWVQEQIADDPTILGLGDLVKLDRERLQSNAGRLDLLLQDPESLKRYEVEIQLGATDESHVIRTVEYWDLERKRYPQYDHAAVIIAEDITGRFLNVIQLFNGQIPLIALKMTAYQIGEEFALTFVKVLDELTFGLVDEDEPLAQPTDRSFWEEKLGSNKTLDLADQLLRLVNDVEKHANLKYNRHYIGLEVGGAPFNFVKFKPTKAVVTMMIKLPEETESAERLEGAGFDRFDYDIRRKEYRVWIEAEPDDAQRDVLRSLIQQAKDGFRKTA